MALITPETDYLVSSKYLSREEQDLLRDGFHIWRLARQGVLADHISDYSFLVAPFAKAYEGFLKKFFFQLNLITQNDYYDDHFRVGKVLNPNLKYRRFSVYRALEKLKLDEKAIAPLLWQAWKKGRNLVFHYFPHNLQRLTLVQAESRIRLILTAITAAQKVLDKEIKSQDNETT